MEQGLDPPCLELGDGPEHHLLRWLTRKARRDGVVPMEYPRLLEQASRGVYGTTHRTRPIEQAIRHLNDDDADYIRRVDVGNSWGFEVLVRCPCETFCGDNRTRPVAAGDSGVIVMRAAHGDDKPLLSGVGILSRVKSESVQNPVSLLARDYFPQVLSGMDIRPQSNWQALSRGLKLWKVDHGIGVNMARQMMDEFGRHPEWCRRSDKPAWRVFLGKRDTLAALVQRNQRRDPSNRSHTTNWTYSGRRTLTSYSAT